MHCDREHRLGARWRFEAEVRLCGVLVAGADFAFFLGILFDLVEVSM